MIGLQRTTRAMLRVHGCACSSSHAAHSERPVDMRMSCRDEDVDKCDSVDLLCATRSRSNLQAVATGRRFEVSSSNLWLRADLPHEGPGNHSVLVNLDAGCPQRRPPS